MSHVASASTTRPFVPAPDRRAVTQAAELVHEHVHVHDHVRPAAVILSASGSSQGAKDLAVRAARWPLLSVGLACPRIRRARALSHASLAVTADAAT